MGNLQLVTLLRLPSLEMRQRLSDLKLVGGDWLGGYHPVKPARSC